MGELFQILQDLKRTPPNFMFSKHIPVDTDISLTGIKREYLSKMTQKAKTIFKEIEIDKLNTLH